MTRFIPSDTSGQNATGSACRGPGGQVVAAAGAAKSRRKACAERGMTSTARQAPMTSGSDALHLTQTSDGVTFAVRAVPRAGRDLVDGVVNGALRVRLAAPPVEGAANQSLVALLAAVLSVPRSDVSIVRGTRGRAKQLLARGLTVDDVRQRLAAITR